MMTHLIQTLLPHFPRFSEEEGDFFSVKRETLLNILLSADYTQDIAQSSLLMLENLLDTLATLSPDALKNGEWCFVSFPAQLLANSILTALSDSDSRLFAANFWNTQSIANDKKDQQRDVLSQLENARHKHHASQQAQPIRYCYVAWCIIKWDDQILFYQREDTHKRFDKTAGDYGLIGGRANQNDISLDDKTVVLNALQSANSSLIKECLPKTLQRELHEETGLLFDEHYTFKPWRTLQPYQQVQGSAPNHTLTEYYLDIFQIDLTLEGYLHLIQKIQSDERLVWFSLKDIIAGKTKDGKIPFINALYDDFSGDREALEKELINLSDSFSSAYQFQPKKYGITFPFDYQSPIFAGLLGKETALTLNLTTRQLQILLGLAANLREFEFSSIDKEVTFYPFGWVKVNKGSTLQADLIKLTHLINPTNLVIENHHDLYFRLSVNPNVIFFDTTLFSFIVKQDNLDSTESHIPVCIERTAFNTAFGQVKEEKEVFKLTSTLVTNLKKLDKHPYTSDNPDAVKIEDNYKKSLDKAPDFLKLGLRKLVRREAGQIKFTIAYKIE